MFARMRENIKKIFIKKFVIGTDIEFVGFRIKGLGEGIQICPDPEKIKAVQDMVTPRTREGFVSSLAYPTRLRLGPPGCPSPLSS